MNKASIIAMQSKLNVTPDGFWGPVSQAACRAHLRSLFPDQNPWPKTDQASLSAFYGAPGDESNLVSLTFPYPTFYGGKRVLSTRVNARCAASLLRVLNDIGTRYHNYPEVMEAAEDYGGVFNFRLKRGGTSYSLHAYGAALDMDDDDNTFRDTWPLAADMPLEIMECFAREGWISAGAFWGYDAMHFQATQ